MRKYKGLPPLAGSEEVSASFDGADAACTCACDAAPKKPQTLEQHLKQYHGGKMPKGDCKFLKQYKKDHPDWQKDAAKATKGEAAVDTVKKDAPKGKKVSSAEFMKTEGFKKGSLVNYRMAYAYPDMFQYCPDLTVYVRRSQLSPDFEERFTGKGIVYLDES